MTTALFNYFGFGTTKPQLPCEPDKTPDKSAVRALPASWYTSAAMYDLERRSIFSRKWILITHQLRIRQKDDYLRYETAGFRFIVYRDEAGGISGFHDLHPFTGEPIVTEQQGRLDANINDLSTFPIHVHIDYNGFIWVNMDSAETPEVPWSEDFDGVDTQARFAGFNFNEEYEFDHEWEMTGEYNWKILADNYNECYHCATTHPDLKEMADLETYSVTPQDGYILHNVRGRPGGEGETRFKVHPTYYFPSTSMNVSPHFFFMQRFVPHGPVLSTMRYEVYRHRTAPEEEFQSIAQMYRRVMSEDKALCEATQRNLNKGIFVNGEMHPRLEQGPLFFQATCRDIVKEHRRREALVRREIWPAQWLWGRRQLKPQRQSLGKRRFDGAQVLSLAGLVGMEAGPPIASVAA